MGAAIFLVFESAVPGILNPFDFCGKSLSKASEELDEVAERLGFPSLGGFVSIGAEEASRLLGEDFEAEVPELPEATWFAAIEALPTVHALIDRVRATPDAVFSSHGLETTADHVLDDLVTLESMLIAADRASIRFRLSVDI